MKKTARQLRQEAHVRQKRIRSGIFVVIVVGVLALAGNFLRQAFFHPAHPPMAGNVIDVSASMSGPIACIESKRENINIELIRERQKVCKTG